MSKRPSLSLAMIVRNEEANLPHSLGPVKDSFDELIVVDTGSTDNTRDAARSYGAVVSRFVWTHDFASARNYSINQANGDYIMWLDADNHIAPEAVQALRRLLDRDLSTIYYLTEVVVPQGERLIQKRVFPNRPEVFFCGRVHEQLTHPSGFKAILTDLEIRHWGYADRAGAREKGLRNLAIMEEMDGEGQTDFYYRYQRGRTLFNLRRFPEALFWLDKAMVGPGVRRTNFELLKNTYVLKAMTLERLGRFGPAVQALRRLVALAPDYGLARFHIGRIFYGEQKYEEAAQSLGQAQRLGLDDPAAGSNPVRTGFTAAMLQGRSFEKTDRNREAKEAFKRAGQIDPANPEPELALARLAFSAQSRREALLHVARSLDLAPGNRQALALARKMNHAER